MGIVRDKGPSGAATVTGAGRPRPGEQLELAVERMAYGGAGVARRSGFVVFVAGGFPGDVVRAEVTKSKRDYANARVVSVIEPTGDRVPERCDHEGGSCPGSPWQGLRYERQLAYKQEQVGEALERLGGHSDYELEPIVPAADIWRYRNKLEYSFGERAPGGGLALGFHARGRWDRVEHARDCMLASERSNAVRNAAHEWCEQEGLNAYDRHGGAGFLRNLVVREGRRSGELQVRLVTSEGGLREEELVRHLAGDFSPLALLWTKTAAVAETAQGGETSVLAGSARLTEEVAGLRFGISPEAFFQTNTEMADVLYGVAADFAGLSGQERVFDIYCGIGTLSLVLALRSREVWGVDVTPEAIADAIENARENEIENARFFAGDARLAIRPLTEQAGRPDVLVVDPPRAGLSKKVIRRMLECRPSRIVYISCNPTSLAPDSRQIVDGGFDLVKVRPVDMFPHTPHIESVALFERTGDA
jgi:23S rRNA (uracil1939-C5)-methyltransferase